MAPERLPKLCLRCDWAGDTDGRRCPACGAPLFAATPRGAGAAPAPAPTPAPISDGPAAAGGRRVGVAVPLLIATFVLVVALANRFPGADAIPVSAMPAPGTEEAEAVVRGFLAAYADSDAERAIGYLANDAELGLLIRSIGADGVRGTRREFRLYLSMLEAWRYEHEVRVCATTLASSASVVVRCRFDYDFLGSDVVAGGPYTGSSFEVTVSGDEVVRALKVWAFDRFSRQMWEPFARWISRRHPEDAARMYEDHLQRGVRLSRGSIERWERHTAGYIRSFRDGPAASDA